MADDWTKGRRKKSRHRAEGKMWKRTGDWGQELKAVHGRGLDTGRRQGMEED